MSRSRAVVQLIMHVSDGQEVWIIPLITPGGEQTLAGLVEAGTGTTYTGPDLQDVLSRWRGVPGDRDSGPGTGSGPTAKARAARIRKLLDETGAETGAGGT
jgi:hypothetical protein